MRSEDVDLVVVAEEGVVSGIVSARQIATQRHGTGLPLAWIAGDVGFSAAPDEELEPVLALMRLRRVGHLTVVDHGEIVGVLALTDATTAP